MARTDSIEHFLSDLADTIRSKTGETSSIPASKFDEYIRSVELYNLYDFFNNDFINSSYAKNKTGFMNFLNNGYKDAKYCPIPIDLGNETISLNTLYQNDTTLAIAPWFKNTDGVTDVAGMFVGCSNAKFAPKTSWVFENATSASSMFNGCTLLDSEMYIYLPSCTDTSNMFTGCTSLTHIDMRDMTLSTISNTYNMFGTDSSTGVPDNCLVIVKNSTEKSWVQNNFSRLTNVKTPEEL